MLAHTAACDGCSKKTKFIEKFLMYQFVMGLRSEFEPVRVQLLNTSPTPSISDVLASLTAEEARLRSLSPAPPVIAPYSVLAAAEKASTFAGGPSTPCEHCKKTNHRSENCFSKYPEKLADYRARRAASWSRYDCHSLGLCVCCCCFTCWCFSVFLGP